MCYAANNKKITDKKKTDYQEGLEKSRAEVQHEAIEEEEGLDGEIMTAHLTIVILLIIITKYFDKYMHVEAHS